MSAFLLLLRVLTGLELVKLVIFELLKPQRVPTKSRMSRASGKKVRPRPTCATVARWCWCCPFCECVHGGTRGALCACGRASRCVQRASAMDGAVREHFVQAVAANGGVPSPLLHEPPALLVPPQVHVPSPSRRRPMTHLPPRSRGATSNFHSNASTIPNMERCG